MSITLLASLLAVTFAADTALPLDNHFLDGAQSSGADGVQFKLNATNSYISKYFYCDSSLNNFCQKLAAGGIVVPLSQWDGSVNKVPSDALSKGCAKVVLSKLEVKINYDACDIKVVRGFPNAFNYVYEKFVFLPNAYLLGVVPIDEKAWVNYTFSVDCRYPVDTNVDATLTQASGSAEDPVGAMVEFAFLDGLKQPIKGPVTLNSEVIYDIKLSKMFQFNSIIPQSCVFSTSAKANDHAASTIPLVVNACPVESKTLNNRIISSEYLGDIAAAKEYQIAFKLFRMTPDASALYIHCNVAICVTANTDCTPNGASGAECPKDALWTQQAGTQPSKQSLLLNRHPQANHNQALKNHVQVVSQKIEIA